jgi:hypothetical protein
MFLPKAASGQGTDFGDLFGFLEEDRVGLRVTIRFNSSLIVVGFCLLICTAACLGLSPQQAPGRAPLPGPSAAVRGTIADTSGAVVAGARVVLAGPDQTNTQEVASSDDGQFAFVRLAPGPFQLTITAIGFAPQTFNGIAQAGEIRVVPIALEVAEARAEVQVSLTQTEVAEEQIKVAEKQRVLGAIPNFYVSYIESPAPLTAKQKFKLASKTVVDPFTFVVVGGIAGVTQAQNHFSGYGQGAQGYGKRFGAAYADTVAGTFIGSAILPSLLKQDPRYFYKGTGTIRSRVLYSIANAVICKGDNGRWQTNYSNILGNLAAGGISNLYYPAQDRNGAGLTFENGAIGIGATAFQNLLQEFLIRKLTPKIPRQTRPDP